MVRMGTGEPIICCIEQDTQNTSNHYSKATSQYYLKKYRFFLNPKFSKEYEDCYHWNNTPYPHWETNDGMCNNSCIVALKKGEDWKNKGIPYIALYKKLEEI